ncbi:MAG: cobalt-precorrin-5B (C(1))-methyltransferase, partial [Eggerthellaceae bacterium]|nr:cobalt-precorrin-5B (C(1))-methyltransferase [Eggerthellaceae bacterium]
GHDFARDALGLDLDRAVQCSNYLGATIDYAIELGFTDFLLIGHIGKMAKVAAGIMNTHSRVADGRRETMAAHAALAGASRDVVARIMEGTTTDDAIELMKQAGVNDEAMASLTKAVDFQLKYRAGDALRIEAVVFSKVHGLLGKTPGADELIELHECDESHGSE